MKVSQKFPRLYRFVQENLQKPKCHWKVSNLSYLTVKILVGNLLTVVQQSNEIIMTFKKM